MTAGEIIGKTLITGHRRFLAKIHPDYFMDCDLSVRKANEELIRFLEGPLSLLGEHWKTGGQNVQGLSSKPTTLQFFTKTDSLLPHVYKFPFSDAIVSRCSPPPFLYQATYSLFGLFQAGNVDISREVVSYVEAKIKDSVSEGDYGSSKFEEALNEHHSEQTLCQTAKQRLSARDLSALSSKEYIQLDSTMNLEQKRAALLSLVASLDLIEEFETRLGPKIPVIFVSPSYNRAIVKSGSIHLSTEFTSEEFLECMTRHLRQPG